MTADEHGEETTEEAASPAVDTTAAPATGLPAPDAAHDEPPTPWWRRARVSTVILVVVFVGAFLLWQWVRPPTPPKAIEVPYVPAPATTATTESPTTKPPPPTTAVPPTTASRPAATTSTTAPSSGATNPGSATTSTVPGGGTTTSTTAPAGAATTSTTG